MQLSRSSICSQKAPEKYLEGPTIRLKSGERARIVLTNRGGMDHVFMIVRDVEGFRRELAEKVKELQGRGMGMEEIEHSEELEMIYHKYVLEVLVVGDREKGEVEVEPGKSVEFILSFMDPGTYYYV